ncbi:hypothetical protein OF829_09250 [Sphingomonas sp. LB-2]|uniref:hypothetical protein n=1 Tax=Sphingomonas caeni TaxID=2984949 RepID=UPI00222FD569|nr:hypothetical protein [Sphingomonas caeni]MCW3847428.1 hypothetical protein [Sphingomonas caeni]
MKTIRLLLLVLLTALSFPAAAAPAPYSSFKVGVYARAYEVREMADPNWLKPRWERISRDLHVDHIWLETHRDMILVDDKTLDTAIKFFRDRGVRVSGGITWTISEPNRFETFCYSNPEHRAWVKKVVEHTARHFDEIILDDFFFTSCKSDIEIAAKGEMSWTDYRLKLMTEAARDLIVGPARAVNPKVRVIIKYPNWYAHFQGLGFNLETEPKLFDGIYTGTETRDAVTSAQHLQPYLGYQVVRYFDNIAPGRNLGGWVDPFGSRTLDRYSEQLAMTLFAKAPEITLFDFRSLATPVTAAQRGAWQGQGTSYDFDTLTAGYRGADGVLSSDLTIATPAGRTFAMLDKVVGQLGNPIGIKGYRPYHSRGEDFLPDFMGMIGLPMDVYPAYPGDAATIFLTATAAADPGIVGKIRGSLTAGKTVVITTGLLRALQDRGLGDIAELRVSEKRALVKDFLIGFGPLAQSESPILIPQVDYLTNDSWEDASAIDGAMGWPMLHDADYSKGHLFVVTIPDNAADLYELPAPLLNRIRATMAQDMFVRLEGPSRVALFAYDNDTLIVESFRDEPVDMGLITAGRFKRLRDLQTGEVLTGETLPDNPRRRAGWAPSDAGKSSFKLGLKPHSFRVFRAE